MATNLQQLKMLKLFGHVEFDPGYDYKAQRAKDEPQTAARQERLRLLTDMAGIGAPQPRDADLTTWVQREREHGER